VNHAGIQFVKENYEDITSDQLEKIFRVNVFSYFYMSQAALKYMKEGSSIINTSSVNAYKGNPKMVDYACTKVSIYNQLITE
jgi:NAD(P)-dependent dehydrogenase (short-subunit alcohol dehydrogenase family)